MTTLSELICSIQSRDGQNDQFKETILCSALLPILESFLRSSSLIEMAKSQMINKSCLDLIESFADRDDTLDLLQAIGDDFTPG